ncbi:MAG: TIGR04076 family protein [Dehalococcoidia bacterium]|jgi:uncharacterized repeat protein (TIGR04076 family)|nr:TIGR04076 family protein [Dehalococcoidia bacterium]
MEQREYPQVGNRVWATVRNVKGDCSMGHKVGDEFEISAHNTAGLCGFFYHDIFPYLVMLQFGGGFPAAWGDPDSVQLKCMDSYNEVTIELRRERR